MAIAMLTWTALGMADLLQIRLSCIILCIIIIYILIFVVEKIYHVSCRSSFLITAHRSLVEPAEEKMYLLWWCSLFMVYNILYVV